MSQTQDIFDRLEIAMVRAALLLADFGDAAGAGQDADARRLSDRFADQVGDALYLWLALSETGCLPQIRAALSRPIREVSHG